MPSEMAGCVMVSVGLVTSVMAYYFDYEDLSAVEMLMVIISFIGCIMITNPSYELTQYCYGCAAAFCYTIFGALNLLEIRELAQQVHSSVITFYFGVISTICASVFFIYCEPAPSSLPNLSQLAMIGVFSWMI